MNKMKVTYHDPTYADLVLDYLYHADVIQEEDHEVTYTMNLDVLGKVLGIVKEEVVPEYEQLQLFDPDDYTIQVTPI
jgi:ribonuclease PH